MTLKSLSSLAAFLLIASGGVILPVEAGSTTEVWVAQRREAPQIDNFTVEPVEELTPGTELVFTLEGTPGARASVTIVNVVNNLPLREIEPGVYEGTYTIRNRDRLSENSAIRANLQRGNTSSTMRLQQPLLTDGGINTPNTPNNSQSPYINSFTSDPVSQLAPGTELSFTLRGTPRARATFSIDGIALNQPMQEISPGTYEGSYVIRRQDFFPSTGLNVMATLQAQNQVVRAQLDSPITTDGSTGGGFNNAQLPLEIITPTNNSRVSGTVEVRGRSTPNTLIRVQVRGVTSVIGIVGVNQNLLDQTVQTDAQGNFGFTFRPTLGVSGTRYEVDITANRNNQTAQQTLTLFQR